MLTEDSHPSQVYSVQLRRVISEFHRQQASFSDRHRLPGLVPVPVQLWSREWWFSELQQFSYRLKSKNLGCH